MIFDYIDQLKAYVLEQLDSITKKSIEKKKEDPKALEVHFAEGFADDLTGILAKTDEDLKREEEESRNHTLSELDAFNGATLQIFSNGYLYDDLIDKSELGIPAGLSEEEIEDFNFEKCGNQWRWRASWTDVHFYFGEDNQPWMSIVQTEASNKSHYEFDTKINNEMLQEAFRDKDVNTIELCQKENLRYKDLKDNKLHFRTVTLPDIEKFNYLTKEGIIEGTRLWLNAFYPRLKDIPIEVITEQVWNKKN